MAAAGKAVPGPHGPFCFYYVSMCFACLFVGLFVVMLVDLVFLVVFVAFSSVSALPSSLRVVFRFACLV